MKERGIEVAVAVLIIVIAAVAGAGAYIATRPQPEFQVENLSLSSDKVAKGEPVSVSVNVANVGDAKGTHTVSLEIGDETLKKKVTLKSGESQTVRFDIEREEKGTYNLNLEGQSRSLEVVEPAEFEVSNLSLSSSQVKPGESVTISVDVSNVGEQPGDNTVELKIDGTVENTRTVTLDGGENTTVSFTTQRETSKTYSVGIDGLSQSFQVLAPAEFELSNLQVSPSEVGAGGPVEISVDVQNVGEITGEYIVSIKINGETEHTEKITLAGGDEGTVSFTTSKSKKQTYLVETDGLETSFSVASVSELTQASFTSSIVIGQLVHQNSFELTNDSNQVITVTKFEYYEEDGSLRNTVTSEEIKDIWGTGDVNPGESFSGTTDFRIGQPTKDEVEDWEYKFYCEDTSGSEFTVIGNYVETL